MFFYFETNILKDDNNSMIITLTAGRAEISLYKERFAIFITYFYNKHKKFKLGFQGLLEFDK